MALIEFPSLDTTSMTIQEIVDRNYPFCCKDFSGKIRIEFSNRYSGQELLDKLYASAKKMQEGLRVFVDGLESHPTEYIKMSKDYVQEKKDDGSLTQEEYDILYGILNSTLPA